MTDYDLILRNGTIYDGSGGAAYYGGGRSRATGDRWSVTWATLNIFRKQNGKVMFAQNAIHRAPGTLRVGEKLTNL